MYCPNCGQEMLCPCQPCRDQHGREDVEIWHEDSVECCKCGLTMHMQWWEDLSWECSKALERKRKDAYETREPKFGGWELCPYCHEPVGRSELDEHCKSCKKHFDQINEDIEGDKDG